jgi:hypothetical protein
MLVGMEIRRVVTGHDDNGNSVFASDEMVAPLAVGTWLMWTCDETPHFPSDGSGPAALSSFFPKVGGSRFGFVLKPPDSAPMADDPTAVLREMQEKLPGLVEHMEPETPGMHTSATMDFGMIVAGRVVLELDDGATKVLGPGDTIVQNGTRHRWLNPFDEPCLWLGVMIGANHDAL